MFYGLSSCLTDDAIAVTACFDAAYCPTLGAAFLPPTEPMKRSDPAEGTPIKRDNPRFQIQRF